MKSKAVLIVNNIITLCIISMFSYVKIKFFGSLPYGINLLLQIAVFCFICFFAMPIWLKTFKKVKKAVINAIIYLTFALSVLWNIEHIPFYENQLCVELYHVPIFMATMFVSTKLGAILGALSAFAYVVVRVIFLGFSANLLLEGIFIFAIFAFTVVLINNIMNQRDAVANKQSILVQKSNALVIGRDRDGVIDLCNGKMAEFLGLEMEDIMDQFFWQIEIAHNNPAIAKVFSLFNTSDDDGSLELELEKNNQKYTYMVEHYTIQDNGFVSGEVIVLNDITDRKEMEEKLQQLATTDNLTGLYNRAYFENEFNQEVLRSERYNHPLSLIMLDIDLFKQINDTYGHLVGDQVLVKVSKTLIDSVRKIDTCARLGGEEFVILLPETLLDEAVTIAERIKSNIQQLDIVTEDTRVSVTVSLGISTRQTDFNMLEMLEEADEALYLAKENGRNQVQIANQH